MNSIPCDLYLDISGIDCAAPSSKLSDALEVLLPGQTLMAVSNKQALRGDVRGFCDLHKLQLVEQGEIDDMVYFLIKTQA